MLSPLFAAGATLCWIGAVWLATSKYVKASRAKKKVDAWIWFFVWCAVMIFIEWPVYFCYLLIMKIMGTDISLS